MYPFVLLPMCLVALALSAPAANPGGEEACSLLQVGQQRVSKDEIVKEGHAGEENDDRATFAAAPAPAYHEEEAPPDCDMLFVDAGSTGSKTYAWIGDEQSEGKYYTQCADNLKSEHPLTGVASFSYTKKECEWQAGDNNSALQSLDGHAGSYAPHLLAYLAATYRKLGKADMSDVVNADAVPILATAGMRLVSQAGNDKVWALICGRSGSGLTFAKKGDQCGTIPGTEEAYYEFLANAAYGDSPYLTGIFTIGGSSAQIAIPLLTDEDVAAFLQLQADIDADLDCSTLYLDNNKTLAPVFSSSGNCADDFIAFIPASDIKVTPEVAKQSGIDQIKGVGVISFLGLPSAVAGGTERIGQWSETVGCNSPDATFTECQEKLQLALENDVVWTHTREYFQDNFLDINSFSYNTYAADPTQVGFDVSGQNAAWTLEDNLQVTCGEDEGATFGFEDSYTCMRSHWTSLYITSFFMEDIPPGENPDNVHDASDLTYDPGSMTDYAQGFHESEEAKYEDNGPMAAVEVVRAAKVAKYERQERREREVRRLLQVPLRSAASNYIAGARIHFGL